MQGSEESRRSCEKPITVSEGLQATIRVTEGFEMSVRMEVVLYESLRYWARSVGGME